MLTTLRLFGIIVGIFFIILPGRAQDSTRLPSYPPLYTAEAKEVISYATNNANVYSSSDIHAYKVSGTNHQSIDQLVDHLCPNEFSSLQKVRSIYFWIAQNIQYKINEQTANQRSEYIFETKQGVCEGFANLFHEMCGKAGIKSTVVVGYVKDKRFEQNKKLLFPNHAWNAVYINDAWHLIDVTWASFNKALKDKEELTENYFRHKLENNFLVDPDVFARTHLPEDPIWQLTQAKVPFEVFLKDSKTIDEYIETNKKVIPYKSMIDHHQSLDSLDQELGRCKRMTNNTWNNLKSYRLGMVYFYKAQRIYRKLNKLQGSRKKQMSNKAIRHYLNSLEELKKLSKKDFGYQYSSELLSNIKSRVDLLQFSN